ncbi:hypothetical protein VXR58_11080 [Acinetobacter pittii]|uniref:hypothetical protein n=1 Tax=Acinetobacter pittii TaxID=48296 RepID=UPI003A848011
MGIKKLKKNELFLYILFLAINSYLFSLLVFVTCKEILRLDSNYISALGSIISAFATFFAAFVAVVLFREWKKQARYLESIKLINKIKSQLKLAFQIVNERRVFFEYNLHFIDLIGNAIFKKDHFGEVNKRILTGQERMQEFNKFKNTLIPIKERIEELDKLIEELSTYLDKDLNSLSGVIEKIKGIPKELNYAYNTSLLFAIETNKIIEYPSPKTITQNQFEFAHKILATDSFMLASNLEPKIQEKYKEYLINEDNQLIFSYDYYLKEIEQLFLNVLSEIRKDYIE